jgi:hypothetical protein
MEIWLPVTELLSLNGCFTKIQTKAPALMAVAHIVRRSSALLRREDLLSVPLHAGMTSDFEPRYSLKYNAFVPQLPETASG